MDLHQKIKQKFVIQFFKEYKRRWKNIQSLHEVFPSEGLVLAYCFIEAMGYYRYGFGDTKLSAIEQFIKVLHEYQENKHFFIIPPLVVKQLPLEKNKRTMGRDIKQGILVWLKGNIADDIGVEIDQVWLKLPKEITSKLSDLEQKRLGHLYQICWAGWYYDLIRTAGVHKAHFPKREEGDWGTIQKAGENILKNLSSECIKQIKFPHQLPQSELLFN